MKTDSTIMLPMLERLMNELASLWIDSLGRSKKVKDRIRIDFENMCPGVIWIWVKDKIKVTGFKDYPDGGLSSIP